MSEQAQRKQRPSIRAWGGFCDGRLDVWRVKDEAYTSQGCAVFSSRALARRYYEDVRPVEIRELRRPR